MTKLLQTKLLTKEFSVGRGAAGIDIELSKGEIVGFLGPNGAGKTTTIRMIMGLLRRDAGELAIFGKQVVSFADYQGLYEKIGFLPSEPAYYDELTARQMFDYALKLRNKKSAVSKVETYAERLKLDLDSRIAKLSLGNKRKVGILLSLLGDPDLIIMDEPTSGLDPLVQREVLEIIKEQAERGAGILFSSHNLAEVESLCDRVIVIKNSRIIFNGSVRSIKAKKQKRVEFKISGEKQLARVVEQIDKHDLKVVGEYAQLLTGDHVALVKALLKEEIADFTVTNPTLDELFVNYYK